MAEMFWRFGLTLCLRIILFFTAKLGGSSAASLL